MTNFPPFCLPLQDNASLTIFPSMTASLITAAAVVWADIRTPQPLPWVHHHNQGENTNSSRTGTGLPSPREDQATPITGPLQGDN